MQSKIYVRKGQAYVVTVAKTDAGFYLDVEPIITALASEKDMVAAAVAEVLAKPTKVVATPIRDSFPKPAVLAHAGVKSWSTFVKDARCIVVSSEKDGIHVRPQIKSGGGWEDDKERVRVFTSSTLAEAIGAAVAEEVANV